MRAAALASWGLGSLVLVWLVGCGSSPEPAPPLRQQVAPDAPGGGDAPGGDDAPAGSEAPALYELAITLPRQATVGEEVTFEVSYQLPDSCWTSHAVLEEPEPLHLLFTIDHTRRDGMCAQMLSEQSAKVAIKADGPGEWSARVVVDGVERGTRTMVVEAAD